METNISRWPPRSLWFNTFKSRLKNKNRARIIQLDVRYPNRDKQVYTVTSSFLLTQSSDRNEPIRFFFNIFPDKKNVQF